MSPASVSVEPSGIRLGWIPTAAIVSALIAAGGWAQGIMYRFQTLEARQAQLMQRVDDLTASATQRQDQLLSQIGALTGQVQALTAQLNHTATAVTTPPWSTHER